MSTRQVGGLLAAVAPEVVPPRDTLRAVAPDRYTLKATIDQECEQGLRRLKDLLAHLDPRMSWGDLVARVVREAVARHDPRGGGRGQRRRRRSADSAGASPRPAPNKTRAAGAPARRGSDTPAPEGKKPRPAAAPAVPAQRAGSDTPAPQGDAAAAGRQNPITMVANAAPPSQSARAALSDGARAGGAPSAAPAATAAPQSAPAALSDGARAGGVPSAAPAAAAAPQSAPAALSDGVRAGGVPSAAPAPAAAPRRMVPMPTLACRSRRSLLRRRSRHSACPLTADRAAYQRMAPMPALACRSRRPPLRRRSRHPACSLTADQPEQRRTPPAILSTAATNPRHGATFPRRFGATSGNATEDAAAIGIRSPGAAATRPICCRSTTCCRSPKAAARSRPISSSRCFAHHRMRHGYGPAPPPEPPM